MTKRQRWATAVLLSLALVLTACSCCKTPLPTRTPTVKAEDREPGKKVFPKETTFSGSDADIILDAGTTVSPPVDKIDVRDVKDPPEGIEPIVAVDIRPDDLSFSPPARLRFLIPDYREPPYFNGQKLDIKQYHEISKTWILAGRANVIASDQIAEGEIDHTTIFALTFPEEPPPLIFPEEPLPVTLVSFVGGEPVPNLAKSWEASEDFLQWTFHLVEGREMADGTPYTSDMVQEIFDLNEKGYEAIKGYAGSERLDDYTIMLTLEAPNANFLREVSQIELPR